MTTAYARPFTDDERAELESYREGVASIAFDPISVGREVHRTDGPYGSDESTYHVQETHRGLPVWICASCVRFTVGGGADDPCVGCGQRDLSAVLSTELGCKSWQGDDRAGYPGMCLIAGSDGCECADVA